MFNPVNPIVHFWLQYAVYCIEKIVLACRFHVSRKGGAGGGGWGHPQGAVHMTAARLGCKKAMYGTEWTNSHSGCMSRRSNRYFLPFLSGVVKVMSRLKVDLSSVLESELRQK